MAVTLLSKFTGSLAGSALGDAIGELAFRAPTKDGLDVQVERAELLRYTDDTAMAIGVAQCLVDRGVVDPEYLGRLFHRNYDAEPWRGYASGPPSIFYRVASEGIGYVEAASAIFHGMGSFGNGSAMRVAPVGLFFHHSVELYEHASRSALPTHTHELALDGAALQAKVVAMAVNLQPRGPFPLDHFLEEIENFARTKEFKEKILLIGDLIASGNPDSTSARKLGQTVAVHESLPFAIYSFLNYPESFENCLLCAIMNGGDRDTLGAMAGAISGAYLGADAIPENWMYKLENKDILTFLAGALLPNNQYPHGQNPLG